MNEAISMANAIDRKLSIIREALSRLDARRREVDSGEGYNEIVRRMGKLDVEFVELRLRYFDLIDSIDDGGGRNSP